MLTMLGSPRRCCDGLTRRETLKIGALSALGGFGLPQFLAASEAGAVRPGKAKSVIVLYLLGGAATQDMYDLKPDAPGEIRGEFKPIPTNVPGIQRLRAPAADGQVDAPGGARPLAQPQGRLPQHAAQLHRPRDPAARHHHHARTATRPAWARSASTCSGKTRCGRPSCPTMSTCRAISAGGRPSAGAGPYGGFLGKRYDALTTECDPTMHAGTPEPVPGQPATVLRRAATAAQHPAAGHHARPPQHAASRCSSRSIDQQRPLESSRRSRKATTAIKQQAYDMLTSSKLKRGVRSVGRGPEARRALRQTRCSATAR